MALTGLVKRYGPTVALDGLDLWAAAGEILGVAGPNGSGKTTMVGVLAGELSLDDGGVEINGDVWVPAQGTKVAVVHQEPQVFANLTVAENLVAGRERFLVGRPSLNAEERALIGDFGMLDVVNRPLGALPLSFRQRVEIIRGLLQDAAVVLFDEPNSALSFEESAEVFVNMHALADAGKVVILVSHRLDELAAHCARVVVIRDGRASAELSGADLIPERIARELVSGTVTSARTSEERVDSDEIVLEVGGWTHRRNAFTDVSVRVASGEILAVMGVEGAGGRELVRSLAGLEDATGTLTCAGDIQYVTGDRAGSLFNNLTVEENLALRTGSAYTGPFGWWRRSASRAAAIAARDRYGIKVADVEAPIRSLSGGNQQKVALAAALLTEPAVVVLEEPTRGVDVGAKSDIYRQLRSHARAGRAAVLYCTEESEVFECADRVVLVSAGRVIDEAVAHDFADVEDLARHLSAVTRTDEQLIAALVSGTAQDD